MAFTQRGSPLAAGLAATPEAFYFVHICHCVPADAELTLGECDYGGAFCAAIGCGKVFADAISPGKKPGQRPADLSQLCHRGRRPVVRGLKASGAPRPIFRLQMIGNHT